MPSGRTHDRLTLWSLPLVAGLTLVQTRSSSLTLWVSGGFLFGGLMFGPDLDVRSRQFQRWGKLRWLWLPYQKSMRHRSLFSHGPIVGTAIRIFYLWGWIVLVAVIGMAIAAGFWEYWGYTESWRETVQLWIILSGAKVARSLQQYPYYYIATCIGLELGAMSHSLADWGGSAYKRWRKKGQKKRTKKS